MWGLNYSMKFVGFQVNNLMGNERCCRMRTHVTNFNNTFEKYMHRFF